MSLSIRAPSIGTGARITTTITYLEMLQPPADEPPAAPAGITIRAIRPCPVSFYRFLYDTVGEPWLWYERRLLDDERLAAILNHPRVGVHVAYDQDAVVGYFELDRRQKDTIDLAYFGLVPAYIGRGIGPWLLRRAIDLAWSHGPARLTVNTNTLDHPAALPTYKRAGFVPYRQIEHSFDDPRRTGIM